MGKEQIPPFEVLFTMDGNRRFARKRSIRKNDGHRCGFESFKSVANAAFDLRVTHASFFALSKDNLLSRHVEEKIALLALLEDGIHELQESPEFTNKNIKFQAIGEWRTLLPWRLSGLVEKLEHNTKDRTGPALTLLLAYDGMEDALQTFERIRREVPLHKPVTREDITRRAASGLFRHLDLYIRTGIGNNGMYFSNGELSLLIHHTYIHSTRILWPNFTPKHLESVVETYRRWESRRRKGA